MAHFTTHVPGDGGDDPALVWNLWWVRHSLLQAHNPFACDYLFHPIGINLAFYTLTVLNGCLSLPLQALVGLIPTNNLILLSSYVIGGYGAFLLARQELGNRKSAKSAAWFAGMVYAFAAPKLFYAALGQFNIASSQWVPFAAMYMLRMSRNGCWRDVLLAALFTALQTWAEMTYASFLLVFLALLMAWRLGEILWQPLNRKSRRVASLLLNGALLTLALLALIAPILANMMPDMLTEGDFSVVGGGFADVFSADLAGFLAPTILHPFLGGVVRRFFAFTNFDKGQHPYFGLSAWLLAAIGLARAKWRGRGFWFLAIVTFLLLSLGPVLRINGTPLRVPMPFQVLQDLPFFKANRYPSRYAVMLALALSVLAAQGLQQVFRKWPSAQRALILLAAAVFLFENLSLPLPLSDMRVPAIYEHIRETTGDFAVLEVPIAWRNGFRITGTTDVVIMFSQYYQTYHGKRLLGGNTSRNPELKFQYFTEMPVIGTMVALEAGKEVPATTWGADRLQAGAVLGALGVRYVVTHSPPVSEALLKYVETILPTTLVAEQNGIRLYAVESQGLADGELNLRLALAEGWGCRLAPAPAMRPAVRLLLPGASRARTVTLRLRGFGKGDWVTVRQGSQVLTRCALSEEWQDCKVALPAASEPVQELWLLGSREYAPETIATERLIGATAVHAPVDIYVRSAGEEFGDFGHIYVSGREASENGRGYNFVVLDSESGIVISSRNFDTHGDPEASQAMASYVGSLPESSIVAVAVADEASRLLGEEAVQALRTLGSSSDLRGCFRCAQAMIGVKGAAMGSAVESWGGSEVQEVVVGRGLTEPRLYFELGAISLSVAP